MTPVSQMLRTDKNFLRLWNIETVGNLDGVPNSRVILQSKDESAISMNSNLRSPQTFTFTDIIQMQVLKVRLVIGDTSRCLIVDTNWKTIGIKTRQR